MSDIFLSYARSEVSRAKQIASELEKRGWTVWWDRQIAVGVSWAQEIEKQLAEARCVIVLWSENSVKSDWVQEEAAYAKELNKLIPVLVENVESPIGFRGIQSAVLTDWEGQSNHKGFQDLVTSITYVLSQKK